LFCKKDFLSVFLFEPFLPFPVIHCSFKIFLFFFLGHLDPVEDHVVLDYNHRRPSDPDGLTPDFEFDGRDGILLLGDSNVTKFRAASPSRSFFAKVSYGGLVDIPYPQVDCSFLFDQLPMSMIHVGISGWSLKHGFTRDPAFFVVSFSRIRQPFPSFLEIYLFFLFFSKQLLVLTISIFLVFQFLLAFSAHVLIRRVCFLFSLF
jgi:hypothetical protein